MKPIQPTQTVIKTGAALLILAGLALSACSLSLPGALSAATTPVEPGVSPTAAEAASATPAPTETSLPSPTPLLPAGMLWLANPRDGNLRVIEPGSGSTAVIIPTGMQPDQVVVGEGAAWALDRGADKVLRVNLTTFEIEALIPIPQGRTDLLRVGEGFVWVAITERPASNILLPSEDFKPEGGVLRIDPHTNQVTGYTASGPVLDMTAGEGALWILGQAQIETPLIRVDPSTLQAEALHVEGTSDWQMEDSLAVTPDSLWLFSQSNGKLYRASHTGHLYGEIVLGQHKPLGAAHLLALRGMLWLGSPWGSLIAIDPGDNSIRSETPLQVSISELASSAGMLWAVSALEGQVYRVDAVTGEVSAQVEIGPRLDPTPMLTATPIQRASRPCEDGPYSRLAIGEQAHTLKEPPLPQRLHKEPGKETERAGWIQPGEHVRILEGPMCADGWVWWKVETLSGGYQGWANEGDEQDYWLIPDA